jgi:hypothetical protein
MLGLTPYIYLIYRSSLKSVDGWGDQRTLSGFLTHFLREEYGTFVLASNWESGEERDGYKYIRRLGLFIQEFSHDTYYVGPLSLLYYIKASYKQASTLAITACYLTYALVFNSLANLTFSELHIAVLKRMWIQASVIGYAAAGAGLGAMLHKVDEQVHEQVRRGVSRRSASKSVLVALAMGCSYKYYTNHALLDRSNITVFSTYAHQVLSALPQGCTILTNDDMNCNTLHYVTRCLNYRSDVDVLKIPLITYEWWKPMQLDYFDNVKDSFPGSRHHPYDSTGFNMKQFLDVNVLPDRPKVFVLGDWKTGDDSQNVYQRIPVGLADLVIPSGEKMSLRVYADMVNEMMPVYDPSENIDEKLGSWETVIAVKYLNFYSKASHYVAENLGRYDGSVEDKIYIGETGIDLYNKLMEMASIDKGSEMFIQRSVFRNAGVVAGMAASYHKQLDGSSTALDANLSMFKFWDRFMSQCEYEKGHDGKDCREISMFLDHGVNPYTQDKFRGVEGFALLDGYEGSHKIKYG